MRVYKNRKMSYQEANVVVTLLFLLLFLLHVALFLFLLLFPNFFSQLPGLCDFSTGARLAPPAAPGASRLRLQSSTVRPDSSQMCAVCAE